VETFVFFGLKSDKNGGHLTCSIVTTGLRNWEIVFSALYELMPKKHPSHKHRAWSNVNLDYRCLRDIDCKTFYLGDTVYDRW
jgi:hypothetical protein